MSAVLLELDGVEASRGAFFLGPVTLRVARGEVVALVGPNGAGKSSVLAVATGEIRATRGTCRLAGASPHELSRADIARRVALVRQGGVPRLPMSAEELVLHGRWVHLSGWRFPGAADRGVALDALAQCGAAGLAARDVRSLSGGELQRVLLARALAQGSPLLLLDEPTSHVDLAHRARLLRVVRALVRDGACGALVVTHDLDLVAGLCDRVSVLAAGRVLASGTPAEALTAAVLSAAHGWPVRVDPDPHTGRPRVTPDLEGDDGQACRSGGRSGPDGPPPGAS